MSKQASNNRLAYRLHLSYIREEVFTTGGGKSRRVHYRRIPEYTEYIDLFAPAPKEGIVLQLPEATAKRHYENRLENASVKLYWEVLLEEKQSTFWNRFLIDVSIG